MKTRLLFVALALAAVALAWRTGGGAERALSPPAPAAAPPLGDTFEVALRLVESAADGQFAFAKPSPAVKKAHWRKLAPPLFRAPAEVESVALRAAATETQWATSFNGEAWAPDARIWNMNEGSFDQREAIVGGAPGHASFRFAVPPGARLDFAEGTLNATNAATVFVVKVVDRNGKPHELHRHRIDPGDARRWFDQRVDLAAFAGQDVELRLELELAPAQAAPRVAVDGGVAEEALARASDPIALWGHPTVLRRAKPRVPYNVLWIVVDALRADALASFHDDVVDAAKAKAPWPPLEATMPKLPGLAPAIDGLAARGVRFTAAYSAGSWTRPGTLAMLAGARSSELGIDTTSFLVEPASFYRSDPPLLSMLLRRQGVLTRAFVNNYFMVGYAPVGIDMGFERIVDHRYRTRDTLEITADATRWLKENRDARFFAFVNYNSPHEPYEPPPEMEARVPRDEPKDSVARQYLGEVAKDDDAIGVLLRELEALGLADDTLVVVTADHGETMSSAHAGTSGLDRMPIRYHHAISNFEETVHVPIVLALPKVLAPREVSARVRSTDLAPTVLELLGLEVPARMSGRSLLPLARGEKEPEPRVVVAEGRGTRSILHGKWRLIEREGLAKIVVQNDETRETEHELYDLETDPGERHDLAPARPDVVAELRARLRAALANADVAGARTAPQNLPTLHLRFAGGPEPRRVSGTLTLKHGEVKAVDLGPEAFKVEGDRIELAFRTSPDLPVGLDIVLDPPAAPVTWQLWLDDGPWPAVYGGRFGLASPLLREGLAGDEARAAAEGNVLPTIDPRRDMGLFVTRERRGEAPREEAAAGEGAEEMARLLREWGYARGSGK